MNIKRADLNLLVIVSVLLKERHITRSANLLHMSQPALSHALARARDLFKDELLVRSGNRMTLTPRARELQTKIEEVLAATQAMFDKGVFDPSLAEGTIRIRATEGAVIAVLGPLLTRTNTLAPKLAIEVSSHMTNAYSSLSTGGTDIVLDVIDRPLKREFEHQELFSNTLTIVRRRGDRPKIGLREYSESSHLAVSGGTNDLLENVLMQLGIVRKIAMKLPGFITAAAVASQSDLLLTLPATLANSASKIFPLQIVRLPYRAPPVALSLIWHKRDHNDPLQKWLRNNIISEGLKLGIK